MPVQPTYPGVYIEEVPSGVRTIIGVSTSIAAFIDSFTRGPLNRAIQIFSMADFEREFGGLSATSEGSYAIQQFFLNGGGEAWVVRTAAGSPAAARVALDDDPAAPGTGVLEVRAGRRIKGASVDDPGVWGNSLRVDVDYDTSNPAALFNLGLSEISVVDGREVPLRSEVFRNLSMAAGAQNAAEVVNEGSKMAQVAVLGGATTRPAETGTVSVADIAGPLPASGANIDVSVTIGATAFGPFTVPITYTGTTLAALARGLENALRTISPSPDPGNVAPLLAGAVVQVRGSRLKILGGRNFRGYNPGTLISFSGATATALQLDTGHNVQQYRLGVTASVRAEIAVAGGVGNDGTAPTATELRGSRAAKTGLYALEDVDLFNILCLPRAADLAAPQPVAVYSEAITYCRERRAVVLVDVPATIDTIPEAKDWLAEVNLRDRNAALYFPRPRIPDPLNGFRPKAVGASGTIAGLYARTDSERGVWKAPAGIDAVLRGVADLSLKMTDPENGTLNPLAINCLRTFPVYGNVCWGARTLDGADAQASEWKYLPVRRTALFLEESLYRGTKWVVFEPNDEPLWAQIRMNIGAFMQQLFRQGAFQGKTPKEAYLVKCDSETTTQADINAGIVNIVVGFAPLKPAEFVIIKITQLAGQIEA